VFAPAWGPEEAHAGAGTQHEIEIAHDGPPTPRRGEAPRREQTPRLAARGREVDVGARARRAPPDRGQLVDQASRLLDTRLLLGGPRLGALAQPLDLAARAHG